MAAMTLSVRRLVADDAAAARQLGFEAFGIPSTPPTEPARIDQLGRTWFGAFDEDVLVAQLVDRAYDSWFGGVRVPTSGIAGVTVTAEYRGRGALTPMFDQALAYARERGAVISGLFPSAPRIYRRFGYELITDYVSVELPMAALTAVPRPDSVRTRRAGVEDFDPIRTCYDAWASAQNGPLSRRGVSFPAPAEEFLGSFTGVTIAEDTSGAVCGYASWSRGQNWGEKATIAVSDLIATTGDGHRALLAAMGSFASIAGTCRIDSSGFDLVRLFLPALAWRVTGRTPYMIKILDVPGAISLRRYPARLQTELRFRLHGDFLADNDGGYTVSLADGRAECVRDDHVEDRVLTPHGLALLYAGSQSCANLRAAGLLSGGDVDQDLDYDAAFGGRQVHIRDFY
jgi:predicted acetyltransferase